MVKAPDFLVAGGPRCGTSALTAALGRHPDVHMLPYKELHFWGADLIASPGSGPGVPQPTPEEYARLLEPATSGQLSGEASAHTYQSRAAPEELREHETRVVFLVRCPLEMVPSLHTMLVVAGYEPERDLATALSLEIPRRGGRRVPPGVRPVQALWYRDAVMFGAHLDRWVRTLGRERVHVIVHDDLRQAPARTWRSLLDFLDIPPSPLRLEPVYQSRAPRSRWLARAAPRPGGRLARGVWRLPPPVRGRLWTLWRQAFTRPGIADGSRPSAEVLDLLEEQVREDVDLLSALLERDLSPWLRRDGAPIP